jgi:CBS domain-containing protein
MSAIKQAERPVIPRGLTAADLMTSSPLSVGDTVPIREALAFLIDRGISGAPVIDEAGRAVGVLSQTDLLVHEREHVEHLRQGDEEEFESGAPLPRRCWGQFQLERVDPTPVREVMTPALFAVAPDTPARTVVEEMCELNVHRLFVVDGNGVLVGVISALDVLRHLDLTAC